MFKNPEKPILICLLIIFGLFLAYSSLLSIKINCSDIDILNIPNNSTASDVAKLLEKELCISSKLFKTGVVITFNQKSIKPGRYSLKGITNLRELLRLITSFKSDRTKFTLIEGWTIHNIADKLRNLIKIDRKKFVSLCKSQTFIRTLGFSNYNSLEGFLYPDTYWLLNTYSEEDIIIIFVNRFKEIYNKKVYPRMEKINLSTLEIVTLASIIQSEAMYEDEMPIISSVYHNRLSKNMKLEADPTVLYFMSESDREKFKTKTSIFKKYKNLNNPYNTYVNKGLPIGPINNPGLDALFSALNPADTNKVLLYFVADGRGRHIFSETLKGHKKAINKIKYGY